MRSRKEPLIFVYPHVWASYFKKLFARNNDRMLEDVYETKELSP
jgi:hypothetical protein